VIRHCKFICLFESQIEAAAEASEVKNECC